MIENKNQFADQFREYVSDKEFTEKDLLLNNQEGKVGYLLAWLLGVPVWILLIVFVIRGG